MYLSPLQRFLSHDPLTMDSHYREAITKVRMRDHWKCMAICIWVSLVSFNLGIDTSTVTSMQAMPGFLQVPQLPLGISYPQLIDIVRYLEMRILSLLLATILPGRGSSCLRP